MSCAYSKACCGAFRDQLEDISLCIDACNLVHVNGMISGACIHILYAQSMHHLGLVFRKQILFLYLKTFFTVVLSLPREAWTDNVASSMLCNWHCSRCQSMHGSSHSICEQVSPFSDLHLVKLIIQCFVSRNCSCQARVFQISVVCKSFTTSSSFTTTTSFTTTRM